MYRKQGVEARSTHAHALKRVIPELRCRGGLWRGSIAADKTGVERISRSSRLSSLHYLRARGTFSRLIVKLCAVFISRLTSSPSKPIATFASSNPATRTPSTSQSAEEATVAEKPARKPTRVATRQAPKKDGAFSPINGLRPASKVDASMELEDYAETDPAPPPSKHVKVWLFPAELICL